MLRENSPEKVGILQDTLVINTGCHVLLSIKPVLLVKIIVTAKWNRILQMSRESFPY